MPVENSPEILLVYCWCSFCLCGNT